MKMLAEERMKSKEQREREEADSWKLQDRKYFQRRYVRA
jgi:hypothetical protein